MTTTNTTHITAADPFVRLPNGAWVKASLIAKVTPDVDRGEVTVSYFSGLSDDVIIAGDPKSMASDIAQLMRDGVERESGSFTGTINTGEDRL